MARKAMAQAMIPAGLPRALRAWARRRPTAVAISGPVASGKSTVAAAVSAQTGWAVCSFGQYVRHQAHELGVSPDRPGLRRLGEELLGRDPLGFCVATLRLGGWSPGEGVVIEGVRHAHVLESLRTTLDPLELIFAFVDAPEELRRERLASRRDTALDLEETQAHSTEVEVPGLRTKGDIELDGSAPRSPGGRSAAGTLPQLVAGAALTHR